jgi:hypothetical protein
MPVGSANGPLCNTNSSGILGEPLKVEIAILFPRGLGSTTTSTMV